MCITEYIAGPFCQQGAHMLCNGIGPKMKYMYQMYPCTLTKGFDEFYVFFP